MNYLDQAHIENFLYVDIETLPDGEYPQVEYPKKPTKKDVKVGNRGEDKAEEYRKEQLPKLIKEWKQECIKLDEKADKEYRGRSLRSEEGRIYCICYAMNDEPVKTIEYKDEKQMTEEFVDDLYTSYDRTLATCGWVGHNIRNFDLPWVVHRIWKYRATKVLHMLPTGQRDKRIIDTSELWGVSSFKNYTSLDSICSFLGLKTKEGIDGGQVYNYFLKGKHEKVYEYCRDDVNERLRPLHNIMRGT